jgi:DNA-directed RNA polymerase specialized sigma24 family protein
MIVLGRSDMTPLPDKGHCWWDRDLDDHGMQLRADVRQMAHQFWPEARRRVGSVLGDSTEAAEIMEKAVLKISHYLDRNHVPSFAPHIAPLLSLKFCQELRRCYARLRCFRSAIGSDGLDGLSADCAWLEKVNRHIDFDKLLPYLSQRSRRIIEMRALGNEWREISKKLNIATSTARNGFWRDIHQALSKWHKG